MAKTTVKPIRGSADDGGKGWPKDLRAKVKACPREREHVYGPAGYVQWHWWAEAMQAAGWKQERCECGLFLLLDGPAYLTPKGT